MLKHPITYKEALKVAGNPEDAILLMAFINETIHDHGYFTFSDLKYWETEIR